ncbi:hypothetical protein OCU04_005356 [Sclerotinia nivalis]|uniref:Uncharacterized protein n=1 Tax=Sclerotinia nivalis TaxID=352851 RepID=A0A9X0ANZ9_9HELO|nr:hypothetical protein OCU04_005356 [Sclerotinia nivalis]
MNYNSESLMHIRSREVDLSSILLCNLTGYWDPSFRILILPRYLGIQTAVIPIPIPIPSSRRITSIEFEGEKSGLSSSASPTPSASQFDANSPNSSFQSPTTSGSPDISGTSSTTSSTSYSYSYSSASSSHGPCKPSSNSSEQPLHTQSPSTQLPNPEQFLDIRPTPLRISTPKPSLDILFDAERDVLTLRCERR